MGAAFQTESQGTDVVFLRPLAFAVPVRCGRGFHSVS